MSLVLDAITQLKGGEIFILKMPVFRLGDLIGLYKYKDSTKVVFDKMRSFKPDIVAFSVTTGAHVEALDINKKLKKKFSYLSVFGGQHPTFHPQMIEEHKDVDTIFITEAGTCFIDFLKRLENGEDYSDVPGTWSRISGKIHKNEIPNLEEDLDQFPYPDRALYYETYPELKNAKTKSFMIGMGCPYKCTYCFNHAMVKLHEGKGNYVRHRSPDRVIDEILQAKKKYPLKFIRFIDDIFIMSPKWIREFCPKYKKKVGIPFIFQARANMVTDEIIKLVAEAGGVSATMAIESGNDHLRNDVLKRYLSKEEMLKACRILKKYNVQFLCQNILGFPGDNLETALETLDFNIKCKPHYAYSTLFMPMPMTELGEKALKETNFKGDYDSLHSFSFHDNFIYNVKDEKELINLQRIFALVVDFPFLRQMVKYIVKLPKDNVLLKLLYSVHKAWCFNIRLKID